MALSCVKLGGGVERGKGSKFNKISRKRVSVCMYHIDREGEGVRE